MVLQHKLYTYRIERHSTGSIILKRIRRRVDVRLEPFRLVIDIDMRAGKGEGRMARRFGQRRTVVGAAVGRFILWWQYGLGRTRERSVALREARLACGRR